MLLVFSRRPAPANRFQSHIYGPLLWVVFKHVLNGDDVGLVYFCLVRVCECDVLFFLQPRFGRADPSIWRCTNFSPAIMTKVVSIHWSSPHYNRLQKINTRTHRVTLWEGNGR